jgi:hypothetical protein
MVESGEISIAMESWWFSLIGLWCRGKDGDQGRDRPKPLPKDTLPDSQREIQSFPFTTSRHTL